MKNIFTVDLEDWYCSQAMNGVIPRSEWKYSESRVHIGTRAILSLLRRHNIRATFFVLGFVAERDPDLVRRIVDDGHEIASHGYYHEHLSTLGPERFHRDVLRAIHVTERIASQNIYGYRAPVFSITEGTSAWALDVLKSVGILYDSSVFPIGIHPEYGIPTAPVSPYYHDNGIMEFPMSCTSVAGCRLPVGGGGYFRQLPYRFTSAMMRRCNREGRAVVFYIHPWELDTGQPRVRLSAVKHVRHYRGIATVSRKLERLLNDFRFGPFQSFIDNAKTSHM